MRVEVCKAHQIRSARAFLQEDLQSTATCLHNASSHSEPLKCTAVPRASSNALNKPGLIHTTASTAAAACGTPGGLRKWGSHRMGGLSHAALSKRESHSTGGVAGGGSPRGQQAQDRARVYSEAPKQRAARSKQQALASGSRVSSPRAAQMDASQAGSTSGAGGNIPSRAQCVSRSASEALQG
jgi:hypothetical protein